MLVAYNGIRSNQTALGPALWNFWIICCRLFQTIAASHSGGSILAIFAGKADRLFSFPEKSNSAYLQYLIQVETHG